MVTFGDLTDWAILAFKNGLRLHFDAATLFKNEAYSSSVLLSVLAMEEFSKHGSLSSYVFSTDHDGPNEKVDDDGYIKKLYDHTFKQAFFFSRDGLVDAYQEPEKYKEAKNRFYESLKHNATYVGYDRGRKGGIKFSDGLLHPDQIDREIAFKQLSLVNAALIKITQAHLGEAYSFDEEEVNDLLDEDLLEKLKNLI